MKLPDKPTLSVAEAAAALGISRNHAFKAIQKGELPGLRIGRRVVVPTSRLRVLLGDDPDEHEQPAAGTAPRARSAG